jgi:hypothetical protein
MGWDQYSKPINRDASLGMTSKNAEAGYSGEGPGIFGQAGKKAPKLQNSARKRLQKVFGPNLDGKHPTKKKK